MKRYFNNIGNDVSNNTLDDCVIIWTDKGFIKEVDTLSGIQHTYIDDSLELTKDEQKAMFIETAFTPVNSKFTPKRFKSNFSKIPVLARVLGLYKKLVKVRKRRKLKFKIKKIKRGKYIKRKKRVKVVGRLLSVGNTLGFIARKRLHIYRGFCKILKKIRLAKKQIKRFKRFNKLSKPFSYQSYVEIERSKARFNKINTKYNSSNVKIDLEIAEEVNKSYLRLNDHINNTSDFSLPKLQIFSTNISDNYFSKVINYFYFKKYMKRKYYKILRGEIGKLYNVVPIKRKEKTNIFSYKFYKA